MFLQDSCFSVKPKGLLISDPWTRVSQKNSTETKQKFFFFKRLGYFVSRSRLTVVLYADSFCFVFV